MWLAFINQAHDFLAQMQRNSFEAYRSHCKNIMAERWKKLSKFCQRFAFKNFPAICFQKAFKHFPAIRFQKFPAICFQKFSSDLLSKFCQLFSFQKAFKIFSAISFQKFSSNLHSKAFKIFPAISFQNFSSDLLSKFWTLRDGKNLKANCFQNFVNENKITNSRFLVFESNFASFQNFASSVAFKN